MSASMTSSPIVRDLIERRARELQAERPWASPEDNRRIAEDLLRAEYASKPRPIPRAEPVPAVVDPTQTKPAPKRRRKVEA